MSEESAGLYRQTSLTQRSSPERLDELVRIVGPKSWISLGTLGLLVALGLAWSVWGEVPVTVQARGVLIYPRLVVDLQSSVGGTLQDVRFEPGQVVRKGDVLGTIDRALLRGKLQQKKDELERRRKRLAESSSLQARKVQLDKETLQRKRKTLTRQIAELREQAEEMREISKASLEKRRKTLQEQLELFRSLGQRLNQRVTRYEELESKGIVSKADVLQLEQAAMSTLSTSQSLQTQLQSLTVSELEARSQDMERRHKILDLENQLQELDALESQRAQEAQEFASKAEEPIEALEREVAELEQQLRQESTIVSPYDGRFLQVTAVRGQVVKVGSKLGVLEIEDPDAPLRSVTCFSIGDGKRVADAMGLQVSPDTAERERYGSIVGAVSEVGRFPVSSQEVSKIVGSEELAKALVPPEGCILVYGTLEVDAETRSGFRWTSSEGPNTGLTSGTTTTSRVVVERRSPLSFVLPILRAGSSLE